MGHETVSTTIVLTAPPFFPFRHTTQHELYTYLDTDDQRILEVSQFPPILSSCMHRPIHGANDAALSQSIRSTHTDHTKPHRH